MSPKVDLGRRATYQDVLDAPAHLVAEIIERDLYLRPRPAPREVLAKTRLGAGLGHTFALGRSGSDRVCPEGWWILDEPELRLGEHIMVPDLVGWRRARMPELPDTAYFTLAPDWVCEVLSIEKHRLELRGNRSVYAHEDEAPTCSLVASLWVYPS